MSNPPSVEFPPLPDNDPHLTAVGLVASNWARLERVADEAIWEMLQANPLASACVTSHIMGFGNRMKALISLMKLHGVGQYDIEKLKSILIRSYELNETRNRIVHDPWMFNKDTNERVRYAAHVDKKQIIQMDMKPMSEAELLETARSIRTLEDRCWETCDSILDTFRQPRAGWLVVARYG